MRLFGTEIELFHNHADRPIAETCETSPDNLTDVAGDEVSKLGRNARR